MAGNKKKNKISYRLILKDSDNRVVLIDVSSFSSLGSGSNEKKLVREYQKVLKKEEELKKKKEKEKNESS